MIDLIKDQNFQTPKSPIRVLIGLLKADCDGGEGEYEGPINSLVVAEWPNVLDWEVDEISTEDDKTITLHWLRLVLPEEV